MKKAMRKDFFMEIKKTLPRFISIFLIVSLGVAFYAGVRSSEPDMKLSADKLYDDSNLMDIRLINNLGMGLTDELADKLSAEVDNIEKAYNTYNIDLLSYSEDKQDVVKVMAYNEEVNKLVITDGRKPQSADECIVDESYMNSGNFSIGDTIHLKSGNDYDIKSMMKNDTYKIVGTFTSAYYMAIDKGTSTIGNGKVNGLISVIKDEFITPYYTDTYIIVDGAKDKISYSDDYNEYIDEVENKIESWVKENSLNYYVLDRKSIQTYVEFEQDTMRIGNIGKVFPIVFFLVAALVSLTTMTRMVEEERVQIGTLKSLGYGKTAISGKYILYALMASVSGSLIGGTIGSKILPTVIINAYKIMYQNLNEILAPINPRYFFTATVIAVICVTGGAFFACYKELMTSPANLMRPESPKAGKRVILERIPFIWKRLNFSRKSTVRNLLRYKKRLFMALFGISGCMALLLVGFGLKDSINSIIGIQYGELHKYDIVLSMDKDATKSDVADAVSSLNSNNKIDKFLMLQCNSITIGSNDDGVSDVSGYTYVTDKPEEFSDYITLRTRSEHNKININDEEVIITEKLAKLLNVEVGDTILLKSGDLAKYEVKVGAIVENYVYHNVFMSSNLYEKVFGETFTYNEIYLKYIDGYSGYDDSLANDIMALKAVGGTSFIDKMKDKFADMLGGLDVIIAVLVISAGGLAFVVLYNLNNINIDERRRELATLKVLGFYDKEVSEYIYRENVLITGIGIIIGIGFGILLHRFVITTAEIDIVMFGRNIMAKSFLYSIIITIVFALIIDLIMHFKLKKIDMATSLKSIE